MALDKLVIVLVCSIFLIGCASNELTCDSNCKSAVTSKKVSAGEVNDGVMYAIPKQLLKFTLDRKKVTEADLAKAVKEAKAGEEAANAAVKALAEGTIADLESLIKKTGDAEAIAKKKLELEIEKLNLLVLKDKVIKATAKRIVAEKNLAKHTGDGFKDTISITALDPVADPDLRFVAKVNNHPLSSETIELKTTEAGLLSGGSGQVKGEADEIFVALTRAISSAKSYSEFGNRDKVLSLKLPLTIPDASKPCPQSETKFEYTFDVRSDPALTGLNRELSKKALCTQVGLNTSLGEAIRVDEKGTYNGLLYPRKVQLAFTVQHQTEIDGDWTSKDVLYAQIIDNNTLGLISLPRAYFADNEFEFEFKSGLLTQYKSVTPNEFLQALGMIPEGLKALISVPAEIIQLKIDYSSKEADYNQVRMAAILSQRQFESIVDDEDILESDFVE